MFTSNIHYSFELEKVILGSILLEKTAFGRMYGVLTPEVFYQDDHQKIFSTISEMWENSEPIDILTCFLKLHKKGVHELFGKNTAYYISRLTNSVCSTANLEHHSVILREMYIKRELLKITVSGTGEKDSIELMDELQERFIKLRQVKNTDDFKTAETVLMDLYIHMDKVKNKPLSGITTGFKTIDEITGGLEPGGMYIVAARPSVGKSAFMGQMVIGAADAGSKVGVISLEMKDKKVIARMASIISDIDFWRIYRGKMYDDYQQMEFQKKMLIKLSHLQIRISDTAQVNIGDIKSKAARLKQRNELDILFIDYLGLIDSDGKDKQRGNREQEVSKISRGIKLMAMEYNIPVVVLCQLNRTSEEKKEKPKLHNLRESGSLEQDADGVMFIHRDWKSGKLTDKDGFSTENQANIIIEKWRDGETAEVDFGFDGPKMKFYELASKQEKITEPF